MKNGFLGYPTSFMLDFVVCALAVLVPLLLYSLFVVKKQRKYVLHIHLLFAISTPLIWIVTLVQAFRRFSNPPVPGAHSRVHKTLGWLSTIALVLTSVTGVWFYYVAFVTP